MKFYEAIALSGPVLLIFTVGLVCGFAVGGGEFERAVKYVSDCPPEESLFFADGERRFNGRAFIDAGYFCVWADGREWSDVLDTCRHEFAHVVDYTMHPYELEGLEGCE